MEPDTVELILLKLPSKSLIRFKAVSKAWNGVITNQLFMEQWNSLHSNGSSSFIVLRQRWESESESDPEPKPDPEPEPEPKPKLKMIEYFTSFSVSQDDGKLVTSDTFPLPFLSSHKGSKIDTQFTKASALIYPAGFGIYCIFRFQERMIALWNPTTRELKRIPFSPFSSKQKRDVPVHGFAHVEYKDGVLSYKIGMIRERMGKDSDVILTVEVYSSNESSWKLLKDCYRFKCVWSANDVYSVTGWIYSGSILNGKFHWLNWLSREDTHIVTFDLSTEQFGRIEVPAFIQHDFDCNPASSLITKLDENNSLCLLLYREENDGKRNIDVWTMKDYGKMESWTKIASAGPISSDLLNVEVLGVKNSIKGLFFETLDDGDGLFFCSFGSSNPETVLPIDSKARERLLVVEYIPSFIPLNGTSDGRSHASNLCNVISPL